MLLTKNILHDRKIAILATDGFDESQLFNPKKALEEAGAHVAVVSLKEGEIKAWKADHWGKSIHVDATIDHCTSSQFDALLIPGGEMNPDNLLGTDKVADFVRDFAYEGKSIASICHGTKVLINTGVAKGRALTTGPSLKKDVISSGAKWQDDEVVTHKGLISSRCTSDSPVFIKKMIEGFSISPRSKKTILQ